MKVAELRDRFLVVLYQSARKDGAHFSNPEYIARQYGLHLPKGFDELVVEQLRKNGWVSVQEPDPLEENTLFARITWEGVEAAERLLDAHPNYGVNIPASDRYVSISHNQQVEVAAGLAQLKDAIRGVNEASEEDRQIALYEIAVFEAALVEPRAAADLIDRFVRRVLEWMTKAFSAAAVAVVAERLVQALLPLLG